MVCRILTFVLCLCGLLRPYCWHSSTQEIAAYFRSECQPAAGNAGKVTATLSQSSSVEIAGLRQWLSEEGYEQSFQQVVVSINSGGLFLGVLTTRALLLRV